MNIILKNFKYKKLIIGFIIFIVLFFTTSFFYVKAFLSNDSNIINPPDSFIKTGNVISIIEEDEKYYKKIETFNNDGSYSSPAMEYQISYDDYAQIRSNGEYDILEKRNRHIVNDVYIDEFYKAYTNGETMAGNYIAEVLDGYFVPLNLENHKNIQKALINDGGVYYLATYNYDTDGNYQSPAMYLLLSEKQYNDNLIDENYDYVKDVQWEISSDGNTIIKTISYYDVNDDLITRPIVLQLTGFDSLEEYINPDLIPTEETKPEQNQNNNNNGSKGNNNGTSTEEKPEPPWTGSSTETNDNPINWQGLAEWVDEANKDTITGEGLDEKSNQLIEGFYDDAGNFIKVDNTGNITPSEIGTFDENSNFKPETGQGYYDADGVWHPETNANGAFNDKGNFELNGEEFDKNGNVITKNTNALTDSGHYDQNGNFIENNGNILDANGIIHKDSDTELLLDEYGRKYINPKGLLTLDFYGRLVSFGNDGYYDQYGLVYLSDGKVGFYNADGKFTESRQNPYMSEDSDNKGFYDVKGNFYSSKEIYINELNTINTINYPDLGIETDGLSISIENSSYKFSSNGLIIDDNKKGYFNSSKEFIKSDKNPFRGGFYDDLGRWIDDSLYKVNYKGEIELTKPYFDSFGLFITPNNDRGYFNQNGEFIINRENPYKEGYYNIDSKLTKFGETYVDSLGNVHKTGSNEIVTATGQISTAESAKGILDKNNNWFNKGIVITSDSKIGYYDEFKKFNEGKIPYLFGYYDCNGYFYRYDDIVISPDGKVGYFDESGKWVDGVKDATLDSNGNWVQKDGTVITPDGKIGYYDENGVFHEGESPYAEKLINETSYLDKNGNIVNSDGTVITPDGKVGYYDENGVFHEGKNPYKNGYYDENGVWHNFSDEGVLDSKGNIILSNGTVVNKKGKTGYYDEKGVFHEGENPYENGYYDENGKWIDLKNKEINSYYDSNGNLLNTVNNGYIDKNNNNLLDNGTVITPDGKVGYYDENGVFHEGKNPYENGYYDENGVWHSLDGSDSIIDSNGNTILKDGTVITSDGKVGYYDKNGVFHEGANPYKDGYYNEKGEWISNGYYDSEKNFIMSDGTIISSDGKAILPDGTIVDGYIDENNKLKLKKELNGDYYYDEKGNKIKGVNPDNKGYYDKDGNYYLNSDKNGFYDSTGTYNKSDGIKGYYDKNGVWHEGTNPYVNGFYDKDGNWHGNSTVENVLGYYDENGVFHEGENPYENGYYDENGIWHNLSDIGKTDSNGNIIMPNGVVLKNGKVGYYDENGVWHEGVNPYENGYYDELGKWHSLENLEDGSYLDKNGNLVLSDGTVIDKNGQIIGKMGEVSYPTDSPLVGYYDESGNFITGSENPYENGYYDSKGNWHNKDGKDWIDKDGNKHKQNESIGYYDKDGNFHLNKENGYYDTKGTYHDENNNIGYYDKDGVFHKNEENPYAGGYYDSQGNWHPNGDTGYFDKDGNWHDDVSNEIIGYYDEKGVFHEGTNPYKNGYYNEKGEWIGDGEPIKSYYNEKGELVTGTTSYSGGYYDSQGNWHPNDVNGYYDKNGTFYKEDGSVGYYDADGIFHEGTNPYINGYYDKDGNWHPEGDLGYYDVNGTYHNEKGEIGYYDKNGNWIQGQENPYTDGWYDDKGNFHPFTQDGYYDKDGVWHDNLSQNTKYQYGSKDYVLFTGTWRTSTENAALRLAGNTVQFTINKNAINKIYSDTGIYVALNSILEYEEAKDIIHNIAIATKNVFIQDNDSCAIIYNNKLIPIKKDERVSVKTLQNLFKNTNIDINIAKTRIGKKYVLAEAIETKQNIKLKFDDKVISPKYPLTVINNEAYVSLSDISDIIFYDFALKPNKDQRKITFTLKKTIPFEEQRSKYAETIEMTTGDGTINYSGKNIKTKVEVFKDISPTIITLENGSKSTYIPVKLIPRLTGCDASYETNSYTINFNYSNGIPFMRKFYDVSNDVNKENQVDFNETKINKNQQDMDQNKKEIEKK